MRTLVHLSDLHFGRADPEVIEPLLASIERIAPDLVVVSGDLTQRARRAEFEAARRFLERLPKPQIVVPGNHDVPLYRVWERVFAPLRKYRQHIAADLEPEYVDEEIAVVSLNTARALTFKNGRVNEAQMTSILGRLEPLPPSLVKVVVTHHPFDLPDSPGRDDLVGRARRAMAVFADCGVDLLLAGHFHESQAGDSAARHPLPGYSALVVQAGTATSTRGRGEVNSFNVIRIEPQRIEVDRYGWDSVHNQFQLLNTEKFMRSGNVWTEVPDGMMAAGI